MTDKVLCPWCGAEMKPALYTRGSVWECEFSCHKCGASGPVQSSFEEKNAEEAARAAALRRYTPPHRPLTLEEVMACDDDRPMFNELKGRSDFVRGWGRIAKVMCQGYYRKREYGIEYRWWPDRKPTDEERSAAEWE